MSNLVRQDDSAGSVEALRIDTNSRSLTTLDIGLLWFGASIAITEIWAGGLPPLTSLGLILGLVAIILGRCIGNGLMAAMGHMGAQTGLPGIMLTRLALGRMGSGLLAILNVLQLAGWTGWMLFVGFLYCDLLATDLGLPSAEQAPGMRVVWVGVLALLCTLWAMGGESLWKPVQRVTSMLLAALSAAMTYFVLLHYNPAELLVNTGASPLKLLAGVDLVVAMSVSWVPLVADYSRYARSAAAGRIGTFWGYFVGGTWMYATGLLVALAANTDAPDQMVVRVMSNGGYAWALMAILLVLASTVTTTFLDIFSTVVSAQGIYPRIGLRPGVVVVGCLGTALALALDVFSYQRFLEAIGLVFLPAFTVVITDYFILRRSSAGFADELLRAKSALNWPGLIAWAVGSAVYDWSSGWPALNSLITLWGIKGIEASAWPSGSSIPCIAVSAGFYLGLAFMSRGFQGRQSLPSR